MDGGLANLMISLKIDELEELKERVKKSCFSWVTSTVAIGNKGRLVDGLLKGIRKKKGTNQRDDKQEREEISLVLE